MYKIIYYIIDILTCFLDKACSISNKYQNIQYFYAVLLEAQIRLALTSTNNKHRCYFGDHQRKIFRKPNFQIAWKLFKSRKLGAGRTRGDTSWLLSSYMCM